MSYSLTWHGHANFQINTPKLSLIIDPWFEGNPSSKITHEKIEDVDLVLVTHDHGDHIGQALKICKRTQAYLAAQLEVAGSLIQQGLSQDRVLNDIGFNIGGTVEHKDIKITMIPAFHSCSVGTAVGYIITLENGYTIYHAGDTCVFSSMELWGQLYSIDTALLPIGGIFTMDPKQAALACKLLKCKQVVPMHWGSFPVLEQNTNNFALELEKIAPQVKLISMQAAEKIALL